MTLLSKSQEQSICEQYSQNHSTTTIAKKFDIRHKRVLMILRRHNIPVRTISESKYKYSCKDNAFKNIDSEESAYFLGLLFADGCIGAKKKNVIINLKHTDEEIILKFKSFLSASHPLSYSAKKGYEPAARLSIVSPIMVKDLEKHGCHERKSATIRWPEIDNSFIWHFIRGYNDGDGCIHISKTGAGVVSIISNVVFLESLKQFLAKNGVVSHLHSKSNPIYGELRITGKNNLRAFLTKLYDNSSVYLDRKRLKAEQYLTTLAAKTHLCGVTLGNPALPPLGDACQ